MASICCAVLAAVRVGVDLNSRCSRKCAAPATDGFSSREPTATQRPTDADLTPGMYSVTTRSPPGSTERCTARWLAAEADLCRDAVQPVALLSRSQNGKG